MVTPDDGVRANIEGVTEAAQASDPFEGCTLSGLPPELSVSDESNRKLDNQQLIVEKTRAVTAYLSRELSAGNVALWTGQGCSNTAFTADSPKGSLFVRVRSGDITHFEREQGRIEKARGVIPDAVPEVHAIGALGDIGGIPHSVMVLPRLEGVETLEALPFGSEERIEAWRETGALVKKLHRLPPDEDNPTDAKERLGLSIAAQLDLRDVVIRDGVLTAEQWRLYEQRLQLLSQWEPQPACFCHDDVQPLNILVNRDSGMVSLIDFSGEQDHERWKSKLGPSNFFGSYRDNFYYIGLGHEYGIRTAGEERAFLEGQGVDLGAYHQNGTAEMVDTAQLMILLGTYQWAVDQGCGGPHKATIQHYANRLS